MSVSVPGGPDPRDLDARYLRAIDDVARWKRLTRGTNELLARLVGTSSQSNISRFLSRTPGYEPRPSRPEMMKILCGIEAICHLAEGVESPGRGGPARDAGVAGAEDGDDYEYYCGYVLRSRTLRRDPDAERALSGARDLCVQAVYGPPVYRPYMAWSLLLTFAARVDAPLRKSVDQALLEATARRARRLMAVIRRAGTMARAARRKEAAQGRASRAAEGGAVAARAPGAEGVGGARTAGEPLAAFGVVMARLGEHLEERSLVEEGVRHLVHAVRIAGADDRVWRDATRVVGALLEDGFEGAETWARELVDAAGALPAGERAELLARLGIHGEESPWRGWFPPASSEEDW